MTLRDLGPGREPQLVAADVRAADDADDLRLDAEVAQRLEQALRDRLVVARCRGPCRALPFSSSFGGGSRVVDLLGLGDAAASACLPIGVSADDLGSRDLVGGSSGSARRRRRPRGLGEPLRAVVGDPARWSVVRRGLLVGDRSVSSASSRPRRSSASVSRRRSGRAGDRDARSSSGSSGPRLVAAPVPKSRVSRASSRISAAKSQAPSRPCGKPRRRAACRRPSRPSASSTPASDAEHGDDVGAESLEEGRGGPVEDLAEAAAVLARRSRARRARRGPVVRAEPGGLGREREQQAAQTRSPRRR